MTCSCVLFVLVGTFWSTRMMLGGIEFRYFLSIPVSAKHLGLLASDALESEWIVKRQREIIVGILGASWGPSALPHVPKAR